MKVELVKRILINVDLVSYVLCGKYDKPVGHIFFHCIFSWKVWMHWCNYWGVFHMCPSSSRCLSHVMDGGRFN